MADDGEGFNSKTSGTGIGLKNVRERLRLVYGASAVVRRRRQLPQRRRRDDHRPADFSRTPPWLSRSVPERASSPKTKRCCARRWSTQLRRGLAASCEIVAECEDGASALEAIAEHQPDVAFLDIRMPGLTGLEVAAAAARSQPAHADRVRHRLRPVRHRRLRTRRGRLPAEADRARAPGRHRAAPAGAHRPPTAPTPALAALLERLRRDPAAAPARSRR